MTVRKNRKYVSPAREKQAADTRNRIMDAAEKLLLEKGFAGMTIADVAKAASVSSQTVYAVFSSKIGILTAAVEDRMLKDDRNVDAIKQMQTTDDPLVMLRSVAKLTRSIYEENANTFAAVYGAFMVSPQLAELESELGEVRWDRQAEIAAKLTATQKILPGVTPETLRDILWAITSRELYYLLVVRRKWTPDQYEDHLFALLAAAIVRPEDLSAYREKTTAKN